MEEKNESKVVHVTVASPDYSDEDVIDNPVQPGVKVDLERLKSGYTGKLHSQSNLPNVLTEYGMEEKENKYKEYRRTHKDRPHKKKVKEPEEHDGKEKRRKKREEQRRKNQLRSVRTPSRSLSIQATLLRENARYSQLMEDRQNMPEGSQYYSKKVSHMMTRLSTPRETTHPSDTEDSQKPEKPVFKKKTERHNLKSNNTFLKNMPKSDIAKIVELQDRLMKEGKLRSQYDIDKFREELKKPEVFNAYFKDNKSSDPGSVVTSTLTSLFKAQPPPTNPRILSNIPESSRPSTREDWAVTHHFPARNEEARVVSSKRQAAIDLEKRFPKPQMPPLKCFTMELGEKPPDPEEIQRQAELKVRIKQRKKFLRKLHRMHQMAMAHSAAASRIMDNHGEIGGILEGTALRDVISVLPAPEDQYISLHDVEVAGIGNQLMQDDEYSRGSSSHGSLQSIHSRGSQQSRGSLQSRSSLQSRDSTLGPRRRLAIKSREASRPKAPPLPLTMDEIRGKTKIIEAKCLSTNWMNYMKGGKDVSAT